MPGMFFCTSSASSSGRITSAGTTPRTYSELLRKPIQNMSSCSSSRKFARPTNSPGIRVRRSVKALTRVETNGYRMNAPMISRPGAANSQGLVGS